MLAALWAQGVTVRLHDPQALDEIEAMYGQREDLILCKDQYVAVQNVHGLCILTAWKQYWSPDFKQLIQLMSHPLILDGRNIYDPHYVKAQVCIYGGGALIMVKNIQPFLLKDQQSRDRKLSDLQEQSKRDAS